jgi:hypothetical protein
MLDHGDLRRREVASLIAAVDLFPGLPRTDSQEARSMPLLMVRLAKAPRAQTSRRERGDEFSRAMTFLQLVKVERNTAPGGAR